MSRIVVCLDCPNYQKGGWCKHKRKDVAALQEACDHAKTMNLTFNPEDKEDDMTPTTKICKTCGRELPLSEYARNYRTEDGLQPNCKDCMKKALARGKAAAKAQETQEPTPAPLMKATTVVVRENLTDRQMVDLLREHGWTVTCERVVTESL